MANSANPEINKKIATSALGTLVIATVFFYLGDRYAETLVTYPGQIFDHLSDAFLSMWQTIKDAPFALDMTSNSLLFGGACFLIIWMIWLRYVAFIGNYRSGEESGSARWGTLKEGKKFKDLQTEDNNLLFTKNFGLALHRPKFDPEYDRNLNVLVVGGSGSGKTFNYVTPNICQLNTSYFVTDPKGTLLKDAGYLFTDNGYKLKSFNTINLDESMHYNPLKYVKTDTDILSFVNCFIMNTNPEGKSSGDPFWENAEKMLYTALIALLRDWFPAKDYNMSSLLTLLSLAEARENDENFKSALDLMFLQIEEGKKYKQNDGSSPDAAGNAGLWDYWKSVNGDVIGWITVPGTDINHPILQAHASDPDYYLHHDIYRNYNPLGALYLDAECEKEGFQSPNAVILGHSLTLGNAVTCFGNIQRYSDKSFASEHQTVLIQTPNTKMRYTVRFANIVKGWEPTKRTVFAGDSDFRNWYDSSRESAAMVLDTDSEPNQVISLVSCSYNFWKQNERTVVTTSIDQKQAQTETVSTESRQTGSGAE